MSVHKKAHRRGTVGALSLVLGVAIALGAMVYLAPGGRVEDSATRVPAEKYPAEKLLGVFAGDPEKVPGALEHYLRGSPIVLYVDRAQRLDIGRLGRGWAVPGDRYVCILIEKQKEFAQSCTRIFQVSKKGMFVASITEQSSKVPFGQRLIVGLVPDNVREVRISTPGFATTVTPVQQNFFVATDAVPEPPEGLGLVR